MLLDLREIIGVPGGVAEFEYEPDLLDTAIGSVISIVQPTRAAGSVINRAGTLTLTAIVDVTCLCVCARCLDEFEYPVHQQVSVYLTEGGDDGDDPDSYLLHGDKIDIGEVLRTEFVLDIEETLLCSEDCEGLCDKCGADLNKGSCDCDKDIDPRLAILEQLLIESDSEIEE